MNNITPAVKCAPDELLLEKIAETGFPAVELYLDNARLRKVDQIVRLCQKYPFRYAVHAPVEGYEPDLIKILAEQLKPEVIVFHDIYWENEWSYLVEILKPVGCKLCLENMVSAVDTFKYLRRFGLGLCLDFEHLILEVNGIFEEAFSNTIKLAKHTHMSGYAWGSGLWHTHIHHSPEQGIFLLNLLRKANYSGMVVSEARVSFQTPEEIKLLYKFFRDWEKKTGG